MGTETQITVGQIKYNKYGRKFKDQETEGIRVHPLYRPCTVISQPSIDISQGKKL